VKQQLFRDFAVLGKPLRHREGRAHA
jgi:hypothetical protein